VLIAAFAAGRYIRVTDALKIQTHGRMLDIS